MSTPSSSSEPRKQRSTEYGGLGQSGYTAGRREHDPALEEQLEVGYQTYPKGTDDRELDAGTDDRFTGRGGPPCPPFPG